MIDSLVHITTSHHDIMYVVYLCACFQANHKESQLTTVKRIMRCLTSTPLMDLWYSKGTNYNLVGYSDFTGCKLDKKNIFVMCHLLENSACLLA